MTHFSDEAVAALATLRTYVERYPTMGVSAALSILDRAGAFAAIDEQADSPRVEGLLAESVRRSLQTDTDHEHAFWGRTGEFCSASSDCTWTYEEYLRNQSCTCGRSGERSPSLHAGGCSVWTSYHNLTGGIQGAGKSSRIDGS